MGPIIFIFLILVTLFVAILVSAIILPNSFGTEKEDAELHSAISRLTAHDSFLYKRIQDVLNDEFLIDELNHMISKDLFKLFAREKIYDYMKLEINTDQCHSHISKDILKNAVTQIIYEDSEIDSMLNNIFNAQLTINLSECENNLKEHQKFVDQFNENSKSDLELHPKEPISEVSEENDIPELSLDDIISTGTVEDYN